MPTPHRRHLPRVFAAFALVAATAAPVVADEHEPPVNLSLRPVDQPGAYFDLSMEPGESRELRVRLGNNGLEAMEVRTYPADAYTMVNGGLGAEERDGEPSGTTDWMDYAGNVSSLPGGEQETRAFSLTVPEGTGPGEYATSLVLENEVPIEGSGAVALDQVIRQVLPVTVRVPGSLEPAFEFGQAIHRFSGERSLVGVEITNTGNARLAPTGDLTVHDDNGQLVSEVPVEMNAFLADTTTQVESLLDGTLDPGDYTLTASMTDPESGVSATAQKLPFTVERPEEGAAADTEQALPGILQDSGSGLLTALVGAAVVLLLAVVILLIRNHRRTKMTASGATDQEDNTPSA